MSRATNHDRLAYLASAMCDHTITADELAELDEILARDDDACVFYADALNLEAELPWTIGAMEDGRTLHETLRFPADADELVGHALRDEHASADSAREACPTPRPKSLLQRASRRPKGPAIAIAVAVMLMLLGAMAVTPVSNWIAGNGKNEPKERETEAKEEFVARLSNWHNDQWAEGTRPPLDDPRLNIGRRLVLESGLAEITYDTGAVVVVEGPAEMMVLGEKRFALDVGKLVGRCEGEQAKGFVVETPEADIEDLGTEFAVDVDRRGRAYVEVFDGKVSVGDRATPARFSLIELGADSAALVDIDADGATIRNTTAGQRRFARVLPREQPKVELLAHYTFDDKSTANVAGEANQLTAHGDPQFVATQIEGLGDAISLDGVDDYAICEDAVHPLGNDSYTWAVWVRFNELPKPPTSNRNLIQWGLVQPDGGTAIGLNCTEQRPRVRVNHIALDTDRTSNYTPAVGEYLHIVGTRRGSREGIYVNGKLQDVLKYSDITRTAAGPIVIGGLMRAGLMEPCEAQIADLQIYRGFVSEQQIQELYERPGSVLPDKKDKLSEEERNGSSRSES